MARTSLGRKALSVFVAATLVVSLNVPISAWADTDQQTREGQTTAEPIGGGSSEKVTSNEGGTATTTVSGSTVENTSEETDNNESSNNANGQLGENSLVLLSSESGSSVSNDGAVASTGESNYATVNKAIEAAAENGTVKLVSNVAEDVTVASGKTVTLDLNGYKLINVSSHTITNSGTLTIKDSSTDKTGVVDCVTHAKAALYNAGTLTLKGGTFERSAEVGTYEPDQGNGNSWYTVYNDGSAASLTVNDGATILNKGGFSSNVINNHGALMTVNGGVIDGGKNAIKNDNDSQNDKKPTLVINGGEFLNSTQYTIMNWSIATINGGKFHTREGGKAVLFNSSCNGVENDLKVTGGSFVATGLPMILNKYDASNTGTAAISGGTFSAEVPSDCLASGSAMTANTDGTYTVYSSLQDAINAAEKDSTVTLASDVNLNSTVSVAAEKSIVLDLNGKTVTCEGGNAFEVAGNLVVKDSTAKQPTVDGANVSGYEGGAIVATGTTKETWGAALKALNGGSVTLESGKAESKGNLAISCVGNTSPGNSSPVASSVTVAGGYVLAPEGAVWVAGNGAVANVTGGVLEAKDNAVVAGNGTVDSTTDYGGTEINISGGQLVGHITTDGYIACGVYHPQAGKLNITGGSIYVDGGVGVLMRAGTANITGGTIQTTGNASGKVGDSDIISNCYGVFVEGKSKYPGAKTGGLSASVSGSAKIITASTEVAVLNLCNWEGSGVEASLKTTGGTFSNDPSAYVAEGYVVTKDSTDAYTVEKGVAKIGNAYYSSLQSAVDEAADGATVTLCSDTDANVTIGKKLTLDLNGHTINGGTVASKATLYITGEVTIEDTSEAQTGTIMREDTDQSSPYYVIDIQENANVTFKSGNVINDSGILTPRSGTSLVRIGDDDKEYNPVLTIEGGTFKQDNFVTIKNDYGTLNVYGGTITSANDEAIKNWRDTNIQGGTVNGTIGSWVYSSSKADAKLVISKGATVNGNVFGMEYNKNYDSSTIDSFPKKNAVSIEGGSVSGNLGIYQGKDIRNKAVASTPASTSIAVSGGTFSINPSAYVIGNYAAVLGGDGKYVVGEKKDGAISDASGNSGTTKIEGNVEVSNSEQLAGDALKVAEDVTKVEVPTFDESTTETTTKETTIGGSKVEVTKAQADDLNKVKAAAAESGASVQVDLAVKAETSSTTDGDISNQAQKIGATATPFKLSVNMVTTVKKSGSDDVTATVPVVETASAIQVTFKVAPDQIKNKRVSVARNHDGVVDILSADVDYTTGAITFSTDKFSDYAVLTVDANKSYSLSDYTEQDGKRKTISPTDFGFSSDYAFAGWYKDSGLTQPYGTADMTGTAYAAFVKVSDLITFKGGSLRMDLTGSGDYSMTSLRFGYEMKVPDGATLDRGNWGWNWKNPANGKTGFRTADVYWMNDDNGAIANLLITPVYATGHAAGYTTNYEVTAQVAYVTADGTGVTACDKTRTRSVDQVATAIKSNQFASDAEKAYAEGILAN